MLAYSGVVVTAGPFLAWLVARTVPRGLRRAYVVGGLVVVVAVMASGFSWAASSSSSRVW